MRKIIPFFIAICFSFVAIGQYVYHPSKTVDSSDSHFGVTYNDPYRWLEYTKQPEAETWFKLQAAYTDSILNNLGGRDQLIAEWKQLEKAQPTYTMDWASKNGRIFYRKILPGENVGKLYYREGIEGKEQLLFNPATYITGKTMSVRRFAPSHDGKILAIAYMENGKEVPVLKFLNVDTKQFSTDSIYPAYTGPDGWSFDDKSFLYLTPKSEDIKERDSWLYAKTKLHLLGTDMKDDIDFFSNQSYPELKMKANESPVIMFNEGAGKYILAKLENSENEEIQYYAPVEQFHSKKIQWKELCQASDSLTQLIYVNDIVYALSHREASNFKLVSTSLDHPDWVNANVVVPENMRSALRFITRCKDYLLMIYSDGINAYVLKHNLITKRTDKVKQPFSGSVGIDCFDDKSNHCVFGITSWIKPYTEFDYDAATDAFTKSSFNHPPTYPAAYDDLQVEEAEVKGHDGVMIPLSIIYKKGIKQDGTNVCLMTGYGAYGITSYPNFDDFYNSLVVRNVIVAIAHVRGGGEKGQAWYKAGFKTSKPNTWKDFISCAEYLTAKGYSSPQKFAGMGTSAGGILISRAITERPDLFAAAICNVGVADAMRNEFTNNGPPNIPELGTVNDSMECKALYEMDGVQHVVKGTKYPAVLCVGGWNDARVAAWQPGKFAAALQNASISGRPVLMKVNYDNGHFTEDRSVTYANFANQYAFVLWQCGHPDFQPKQSMTNFIMK